MSDLVLVRDAAEEFGVSRSTIFRWIKEGLLTRYRQRGQRAILVDRQQLRRLTRPAPEKR
jgi:excisionase family DNA binding protein